tara:strand:+ start:110 stop:307 length:198 start_codon:yes stop_codon:yes gene_type:complete
MSSDTTATQERMSLTFTKKDTWIKNEIEREVELNPYWSKTGFVKNALMEHFARKRNANRIVVRPQ